MTRRMRKTTGYFAPFNMSSSSPMPMVSLKRSKRNSLKGSVSRHSGYLGQVPLHVLLSGQMASRDTNAGAENNEIESLMMTNVSIKYQ